MSTVTNIILLVNDCLENEEINEILEILKPLEDQELNPGKNAFKYIENESIGCSRNLEGKIFIGAINGLDHDLLSSLLKMIKILYNIQVIIKYDSDDQWGKLN